MAGLEADTSSYLKAQPPVNPLDVAGKLGQLQMIPGQLQQQQQQIQSNAIGIDQAKLKLYNDHFQIMQNELSTLANDPKTTKEEVLERMHRIGDGFNMPDGVRRQMEAEFSNAPSNVPLGKDGSTNPVLSRTLDLVMKRGMDMSQRINSQYGGQGSVSDGQNVTPSRTFLRGGPVPSGAPIAQQAPPTTQTTRKVVSPTGEVSYEPALLGSVPTQIPPNASPVPGGFPGQYNNRLNATPPLPTGPMDVNKLPTNPLMKKGEVATSAEVMPSTISPRGAATGAPTGAEEGIKSEVAQGASMANDLSLSANESKNVKALIGNMRNALKDFTPGPLADYKLLFKSFANSNLPVPESWKKEGGFLDPKSIASQEEFNKFSQQISQAQLKALGGTGATAHLDSVQHTSPGQFMSKLGIHGILATLEGNQDAIEAKNKEWRNWRSKGNGVDTMNSFNQKFNEAFDPRVFQLKYVSPEDRKKYVQGIDNAEDAMTFVKAYHHAKAKGWINYDLGK